MFMINDNKLLPWCFLALRSFALMFSITAIFCLDVHIQWRSTFALMFIFNDDQLLPLCFLWLKSFALMCFGTAVFCLDVYHQCRSTFALMFFGTAIFCLIIIKKLLPGWVSLMSQNFSLSLLIRSLFAYSTGFNSLYDLLLMVLSRSWRCELIESSLSTFALMCFGTAVFCLDVHIQWR
jgi:hypothetical protein